MNQQDQQAVSIDPAGGKDYTVVIMGGGGDGPAISRMLAKLAADGFEVGFVENFRYINDMELKPSMLDSFPIIAADLIEPPPLRNDLAALRRGVHAREKQNRKRITGKGRRR